MIIKKSKIKIYGIIWKVDIGIESIFTKQNKYKHMKWIMNDIIRPLDEPYIEW